MTTARPTCTYEHVDAMTANKGWFQNQLWTLESAINGRWSYWLAICMNNSIGSGPEWAIPQLDFSSDEGSQPKCGKFAEHIGSPSSAKSHALDIFRRAQDFGSNHLQQLVDWWLWGFGSPRIEQRPRMSPRGAVILYNEFELHRMIGNPADWGATITADILGGAKSGTAWFPTPMCMVRMMTELMFGSEDRDTRLLSVNEPCVGTGGFLLEASNYSLDLSCQDIDPLMVSWTEFAGWLFIPWLVWGRKSLIREFREARDQDMIHRLDAMTTPEPAAATTCAKQGFLFDLQPVE